MSTSMRTRNRRATHTRDGRRAFTLIEIVVVVIIIGVLATLIAPRILGRIGSAKESAAKSNIRTLEGALQGYLADLGLEKPQEEDLGVLLLAPDDGGGPNGPYITREKDLIDPWDNPYVLRVENAVSVDFDIISAGADGELDTEDDITNYD